MTQPLVLAIEPDLRQAAILKRIVRDKALADVAVVETIDAAIEAIRTTMPDVLLLTALLSPRDEDELMAHLRTLDNADHLQTHTIPQLASSLEVPDNRVSRGLLSAFRRKKEPEPINSGCDPDLFAEEIRVFTQRAAAKRRERAESGQAAPDMRVEARTQSRAEAAAQAPEPPAPAVSSWSSPFEWKPSRKARRAEPEPAPAAAPPPVAEVAPAAKVLEPVIVEPVVVEPVVVAPVVVEPLIVRPPQPAQTVTSIVRDEPTVEPVVETEAPSIAIAAAPVVIPDLPHIEIVPIEPGLIQTPVAVVRRVVVDTEIALEPLTAKSDQPAQRAEPVNEWAPAPPASEWETAPPVSEWEAERPAAPSRASAKTSDRLGPLAGWARAEPRQKPRPEVVTADDVRALISSLAVPPAVASVTYARGCRIRRVRVAAAEHDVSEPFGTVILSKRILDEQRERRPTA